MTSARGTARWLWLPPAVTALTIWPIYALSAEAERGSRAGAEPVIAGLLSAAPFVLLLVAQIGAALYATSEPRRATVTRCLVGSTAAAAIVVGLLVWLKVDHVQQGYPWSAWADVLVALTAVLTLPLAPAWLHRPRAAQPGG